MDLISNLSLGFSTALSIDNVFYCFLGALLGTLVGVLPGLGPSATIAMLLPLTFALPPTSALIMLSGIYYGAQYGGSTTAILVNLPGEASSVVTALDGHEMAKKGRGGAALATAALGSFFAGTVAIGLLAVFAKPLTQVALQFGPADYFSLMVLGLVASVTLASGSLLKALCMVVLGIMIGLVGQDINTGAPRFTFGMPELFSGVEFVAVAMGLFGLGEIIRNLEAGQDRSVIVEKLKSLWLTKEEVKAAIAPVLRGTVLGSILGILPGGGAVLSSFASYALEKKVARDPSRFGKGAIEGVAGPESANNAGAQTSFIPMLTLGIPSNPIMALMLGALIIQGVTPGPNLVNEKPELFWGVVVSMWVGNLILLILNLPLVGIWIKLLKVPYEILFPVIVAVCCIGVYSVNNSNFDVYVMALFGALGYALYKLKCEPAPLLLGLIIGPMLEEYLRRAMIIADGDPIVFVTRPISAGLLFVAAVLLVAILSPSIYRKREEAFQE